jgi:hypothetical protein
VAPVLFISLIRHRADLHSLGLFADYQLLRALTFLPCGEVAVVDRRRRMITLREVADYLQVYPNTFTVGLSRGKTRGESWS